MLASILICSRCTAEVKRPHELAHSTFAQNPFVCENCRCISCSIVLNIECECGERHAEPSPEDPRICVECQMIRARIAEMEPEMLQLRNREIEEQEILS